MYNIYQYKIHPLITYFVDQGVPLDTVILLLIFPVIVMLIAFLRQVVGIKAFGIYTPSIVTFALLATGLKYGVAIYICIITMGMLIRYVTKKLRILYLPRVAILLTIIALSILAVLVLGGSWQRTGFASVSIFPLLIMITLVEKFIAAQIEKGNRAAVILAIETLIISLIGFYLAQWDTFVRFIMAYPWAVLFIIPIGFALGKWTGLRFTEYFRFRKVLKNI